MTSSGEKRVPLNVKKTLLKAHSLSKKGDLESAARLFTQVLEQFPQNKQAARGMASLGRSGSGSASDKSPRFQHALQDLVRLFNAGHVSRALIQGEAMLASSPREPVLHNLVGAANTALHDYDAALPCFLQAIELQPDYAEAYSNLGAALNETGDHLKAITAYSRAIELDSSMYEAHNNLGNVYKDCQRYDEALACYRRAIELKPDFATAHNNLGSVLSDLGHYDEGIAHCSRALDIQPEFPKALAGLVHQLARICDWDALRSRIDSVRILGLQGEGIVPFDLLQLDDSPERNFQRSVLYAKNSFNNIVQHIFPAPAERPEKLRIGYFSADFHDHATLYLMARLFELHDSDKFIVHAFSNGPDDGGKMRRRLCRAVAGFHDIRAMGDRQVTELARGLGLDIAVDLKGYTRESRMGVFALRAAPIQISYLGYPGTTGAAFMDYIIADKVVVPAEQQAFYTEQLIYLPNSYQVNDNTRIITDNTPSRQEAGLPETGFVFCCFNNTCKIGEREFTLWMQLLVEIEGSVLWLYESNHWARDNLLHQAKSRGVDPGRLVFAQSLPHSEHLARHQLADLFLDTFNYNAHTTASDALWAGLPVLTHAGAGFPARVAASLLQALDLPELITHSEEDYVKLALDLARQPRLLTDLKEKLIENRLCTALFDTESFAEHLEQA
jgi:protein O-GlcNAc transferase